MINLFEQAIAKGELLKFALGDNEYFIADSDFGDHSVIKSWISHVIPLIEKKGLHFVNKNINDLFKEIIDSNLNLIKKNECLLYNLHVYYYLDSEGRIKAEKLMNLNGEILNSLNEFLNFLSNQNDPKEKVIINAINLIKSRGGLTI